MKYVGSIFIWFFKRLAYNRNKWIYRIFLLNSIIGIFSYNFYNFYKEKNKFKICVLYSYETELVGLIKTTQKTIDSILNRNMISYRCDYIKVDNKINYPLENKYDLILSILPINQTINSIYSVRAIDKNTVIIDLLSHSIKLPLENDISNFYNLKYQPYDTEIIDVLDRIIGKSKTLFILTDGYYSTLIKDDSKRIIQVSNQDYIHIIRQNISYYDTIAVDYPFQIEQIAQIDKICLENDRTLTLFVLNNNLFESKNFKLKKLDLISLAPSKDSIFYSNYSKILKSENENIDIYKYLLANYLSVILNEVKKDGIYTFNIENLKNKEINSSVGIIKFNDQLVNTNIKPVFYNLTQKIYYE